MSPRADRDGRRSARLATLDDRIESQVLASALLASCIVEKPAAPPVAASGGTGIYKVGLPHKVGDIWYYPGTNYAYDETGLASWYGEEFRGKLTANGEIFDPDSLTAAHPTLPLPSIVQVTNRENGRSDALTVFPKRGEQFTLIAA